MPGDYVEGREVLLGLEEQPLELVHHHIARVLRVVEPGHGGLEVPWVGQPIGACRVAQTRLSKRVRGAVISA